MVEDSGSKPVERVIVYVRCAEIQIRVILKQFVNFCTQNKTNTLSGTPKSMVENRWLRKFVWREKIERFFTRGPLRNSKEVHSNKSGIICHKEHLFESVILTVQGFVKTIHDFRGPPSIKGQETLIFFLSNMSKEPYKYRHWDVTNGGRRD